MFFYRVLVGTKIFSNRECTIANILHRNSYCLSVYVLQHCIYSFVFFLFYKQHNDHENELDKIEEQLINELNGEDKKEEDSELILTEYHSDGDFGDHDSRYVYVVFVHAVLQVLVQLQ